MPLWLHKESEPCGKNWGLDSAVEPRHGHFLAHRYGNLSSTFGSSSSRRLATHLLTHLHCHTAPKMTNLGPLTTTFTATGADCQSTYLAANNDNQWIQYGQPDTTQCVPPSFTPFQKYYYSPGICPSGYYYACEAGVGTSSTQATCCPTLVIRDIEPRVAVITAMEHLRTWRREYADFI